MPSGVTCTEWYVLENLICAGQKQRRRTEPQPVHSVSRPPLWDECHKCSALACRRRCKHWTHPTRDRRVKPRNRRTAPHSCGRFSASALDPKTEKDMLESRPPSLATQACRPKKNASDQQRSSQRSDCIPKPNTHTSLLPGGHTSEVIHC